MNIAFIAALLASAVPVYLLLHRDGQPRPVATSQPERVAAPVRLRFMFWGGPEQVNQEHDVKRAFDAEMARMGRGDIEADFISGGNRYQNKLAAMISAGDPPDVFMVSSNSIPVYADREQPLVRDITDRVLRDRAEMNFDDLVPEAVRTYYCNGRLVGFPRDYKTTGLVYNARLLAAAGLEDPNDLDARNEWTWEKFTEYMERTGSPAAGDTRQVFGLFQDAFSEGYWANILFQAGGAVFTDDGRGLLLDDPDSIRGLQFISDLVWKQRLAKPWSAELGQRDPWLAQECVLMGFRGWFTSRYIRDTWRGGSDFTFAWDVAPWPMGPRMDYDPSPVRGGDGAIIGWRLRNGRVVLPGAVHWASGREGQGPFRLRQCTASGVGYCMSASSRHPEEAWMLLKFLVGQEAQRVRSVYELRGQPAPGPNMPSRRSVESYYLDLGRQCPRPTFSGCLATKNDQPLWPRIDVFLNARRYGKSPTGALGQDEIGRQLDRMIQRMMSGQPPATPQEVAASVRERAEQVYQRQRESPYPNSYNTPTLIRPPEQDPLGLAPRQK